MAERRPGCGGRLEASDGCRRAAHLLRGDRYLKAVTPRVPPLPNDDTA